MTTTTADVVGIFAEDGTQKFVTARSMRIQTTRSSKAMSHPLETGASVTDHRVILPIEAQLLVTISRDEYAAAYGEIAASFNSGEMFKVQCRAASFENMFIVDMPHEEVPEKMDAIDIVLKLQEAQFFKSQATASSARGRSSKSSSTAKRGEQAPRNSVAYDIFH